MLIVMFKRLYFNAKQGVMFIGIISLLWSMSVLNVHAAVVFNLNLNNGKANGIVWNYTLNTVGGIAQADANEELELYRMNGIIRARVNPGLNGNNFFKRGNVAVGAVTFNARVPGAWDVPISGLSVSSKSVMGKIRWQEDINVGNGNPHNQGRALGPVRAKKVGKAKNQNGDKNIKGSILDMDNHMNYAIELNGLDVDGTKTIGIIEDDVISAKIFDLDTNSEVFDVFSSSDLDVVTSEDFIRGTWLNGAGDLNRNMALVVELGNGEIMTANLQAVPLPMTVWLFGSGLVGLFCIAKRRKA